MRFDLNAILKLIEVGAAITPSIIAAVKGGQIAVIRDGVEMSPAELAAHFDAAEAQRATTSANAVDRIERREQDDDGA